MAVALAFVHCVSLDVKVRLVCFGHGQQLNVYICSGHCVFSGVCLCLPGNSS